MKHMVCGNDGHEPQAELVAQLSQEVFNNEIFELVLKALPSIDFEVKYVGIILKIGEGVQAYFNVCV